MENTAHQAIAIVGLGAVLPDAPDVATFWENIKQGRYSVTEVPTERWDPALYYDPDPAAPDKTYSKIGGWVRAYPWDPMKWRMPIPPRVGNAMDEAQKWAISCTRAALEDYGYPQRPLDGDRTAVILGSAIAGEKQYYTVLRAYFPEYEKELAQTASFAGLPAATREKVAREFHERVGHRFPEITEDTMPGELANCIAGRVANLFNFHGPNFVTDAACASAMAGITAAVEGLRAHDFDAAITGGIDRNMGPSTYIKFCKIGALSATGTRPFADGADGFVMGEGAATFVLKRLEDAERDGDKIYAVLIGMAGSSDGKGKGITAPNPIGQKLAMERAWRDSGVAPALGTYIEGHGTSTKVGDLVEVESLLEVLKPFRLPTHSVPIGSVKSNFGHLKAGAGAAGLLKAVLSLHNKMLAPSLHCEHTNPGIDFVHSPVYVNTELRPWEVPAETVRRAGVSAFGFGGTNFHAVLEEYIPGRLASGNGKRSVAVTGVAPAPTASVDAKPSAPSAHAEARLKTPLRGALVIGAGTEAELVARLSTINKDAEAGRAPAPAPPFESDLHAPERIAIDYTDAVELAEKSARALKAIAAHQPATWKALRAKGIFRGHGPASKVAFLYTGQGSQYVNMLQPLRATEPIVTDTFAEADHVMTPLLGKPLSEFVFVDKQDPEAIAKAEEDLKQTAITQPAVLATDISLTRLFAAYGVEPDMTMGHSLGEYGALVAAGGLPFGDALEAVSARGREMTRVSVADNGRMAAIFAPLPEIERVLKTVDGYVVIANINSNGQAVIGGASKAVEDAMNVFQKAGYHVIGLPVSHAFHTSIVAPASEPLRRTLERLHLQPPRIPVIANVNGEFYPMGPNVVPQMVDILGRQVASPVQFIKGLETLYAAGARVFVETGPKRALQGFAEDVLGSREGVVALAANHPKNDIAAFNQALCGMYAAGLGRGQAERKAMAMAAAAGASATSSVTTTVPHIREANLGTSPAKIETIGFAPPRVPTASSAGSNHYEQLGRFFADVLERGWQMHQGDEDKKPAAPPVVITGAALGLPGTERIFDDSNLGRMLRGDQFIKPIPPQFRQAMLDKHITRLVKSDNGGPTFESINNVADVIKLAARGEGFDIVNEYGISAERAGALERTTQLAIASGLDALRDAGIPLVMRYKTTTKGTQLPDRWMLPEPLRDEVGVIFASAFPGLDALSDEIERYHQDHSRHEQLAALEDLRSRVAGDSPVTKEIVRRIDAMRAILDKEPYIFDRRFLWRVLSMGHSQFAEYIGARGPNTQINSACASTTQAVALAEDWISAGRCRRVIIVSADDVTSDHLLEWIGAGFLASGAAATDEVVEEAAIPFDRRRHGLIIGMGAAALVVEDAEAARERGLQPICEVLSSVTANSAFHGSRLDVPHIGEVMERLISQAEAEHGISRQEIAPQTVFVSHETYTPARGGSASAEIHALRRVFGDAADQIVIANTKGFTGHAMGTGMEDVVAVKALETGLVPPVANFKEVDPELGSLNLSKGGSYPIQYALHLGAGFGSQISMELLRWVPTKDGVRRAPDALGYTYRITDQDAWQAWLTRMTGAAQPELEVVKRTLRVKDQRRPAVAEPAAAARPVAKAETPAVKVQAAAAVAAPASMAAAPAPVVLPAKPPEPERKVEVKVTPPPPAPVPPKSTSDSVKERVLAVVSEKTGYPIEMLDLDLDLEADLGVDTVKQAEVFAAVREAYGIPRDESLKLRDFPTLAHVIQFVHSRRPDLAVAVPTPVAEVAKQVPEPAPAAALPADDVKEAVLNIVTEKTGYPKDMLALDLDLEADLGIDTVKQAEMFAAIRERYNIPRDENRKLRDYPTLAHVIRFVFEQRPDLEAKAAVPPTATPSPIATTVPAPPEPPAMAVPLPAAQPTPVEKTDDVTQTVLAIVTEKTGYPKDMLDFDLDLEADLGIDTVKQAEMFAAIRERYNIPRDENRKLRDYPTLAHVIRFVYEQRPDLQAKPAAAPAPVATPVPATPEPAAAVAPAPMPESAPVAAGDDVTQTVLAIVTEKTGYPEDMLDFELDLEADLGIDTVKQAEMFAAIRERYNIPRDENRKLRDYPTLAHVIRFVYEQRPDLQAKPAAPPVTTPTPAEAVATAATPEAPAPAADDVTETVLAIVTEKTGYPKDMLNFELDLEADLGIDTVKQAEMFAAIRELYNIPRDENRKLRDYPTLAHVIRFVYEQRPDLAAKPVAPPAPAPASVAATAPITEQPAPHSAPVAAADTTDEAVKDKVLEIVAEKTGYPKEMLDLDLDLEADLGIDTVKQAEMFAAVRAAYNIPRDENLKLRDFPTLAHVIQFARERMASAAPAAPSESRPAAAAPRPPVASFEAAERIPRRVPVPTLRPPLAMCKPTGVTLGSGRRVIVMPDGSGVADALTRGLQKAGAEVMRIEGTPEADSLTKLLQTWLAAGPIHGVYWLPALDDEGTIAQMDLSSWHDAVRLRLKSLYVTMRCLYEQIAKPDTFLVSATRMGGQHGYDEAGALSPMGGAVVGFTKTYKRERPECLAKAVDFESARQPHEIADLLIAETLSDPGTVEIGYKQVLRWTIGLQEQLAADGQPGMALSPDTVFLITGAAGSIVSAITSDLAAASGGTFYLLDLVPKPDPNNPDLKRFVSDKDGLKRELFARIQASGVRATPVMVEKELAGLERAVAAQAAIDAVHAAGGTPHYFAVNLTDPDAVARIIGEIRQRSGRIDVLLHAAGMERSHFLPDKDPREFDLVFDVKVDGWFNLLRAIGDMPLGATVAFSSIAGRFGNAGQADYSSANDLLCKMTSSFRHTRPATRGIVIDWTAWGGIGMATRGSIPKMMELAGIDMLPPEAGVPWIRLELTAGGTRGEVVVAQRIGVMMNEFDPTGGLDANAVAATTGPMIGKAAAAGLYTGLIIETTLEPAAQAFLHDHQIDNTPVLPGVMGVEAFAEAARWLLPGWHVDAVENVDFLAPFKFYRSEPRTVTVEAFIHAQRDAVLADVRLIGRRRLPTQTEPQVTVHFTGQVRLTKAAPQPVTGTTVADPAAPFVEAGEIYKLYFHGPAYQVIERAWRDGGRVIGQLPKTLPAHHQPSERPLSMAPRLIELCFQTAGLWEMAVQNRMGLPHHIDRVRVLRSPDQAAGRICAVVTPNPDEGTFTAEVVDAAGNRYVELSGYSTIALPNAVNAEGLKVLQAPKTLHVAAD